ncbi:MAG: co-chaperone GroES [Candidatus Dadabacteria bacterium]|nr:co-chaperone GroES [Candidatus Dadabacteria bacterium]NIQ14852.1 co-chaperone GroES [Candidatus Dadabacteria bacterium]
MKLRPLHDKVLLKRLDQTETTEGGIIIPDTAAEKPQEAEVIAVGKGRLLENGDILPLDVKPGDKVIFNKYGISEITVGGEDMVILSEHEILGIIE